MSTVKRYPWMMETGSDVNDRTVDSQSRLSAVETQLLAGSLDVVPDLPGDTIRELYPEIVTYGTNGEAVEGLAEMLVSPEKSLFSHGSSNGRNGQHECSVLCELSTITEGYVTFAYHVRTLQSINTHGVVTPFNYVVSNIKTLAAETSYGWSDVKVPGASWGEQAEDFVLFMLIALAWDGIPDIPALHSKNVPTVFRENVKSLYEVWKANPADRVYEVCPSNIYRS